MAVTHQHIDILNLPEFQDRKNFARYIPDSAKIKMNLTWKRGPQEFKPQRCHPRFHQGLSKIFTSHFFGSITIIIEADLAHNYLVNVVICLFPGMNMHSDTVPIRLMSCHFHLLSPTDSLSISGHQSGQLSVHLHILSLSDNFREFDVDNFPAKSDWWPMMTIETVTLQWCLHSNLCRILCPNDWPCVRLNISTLYIHTECAEADCMEPDNTYHKLIKWGNKKAFKSKIAIRLFQYHFLDINNDYDTVICGTRMPVSLPSSRRSIRLFFTKYLIF